MPDFITNIFDLLSDGLKWILYLAPPGGAFVVAYHALLIKHGNLEPGDVDKHKKAMRNTFIYTAIAFSASGLVTLLISYFK